jgi:hypothetical protein
MKDAELPQYGTAVVVDFFSSQVARVVEPRERREVGRLKQPQLTWFRRIRLAGTLGRVESPF